MCPLDKIDTVVLVIILTIIVIKYLLIGVVIVVVAGSVIFLGKNPTLMNSNTPQKVVTGFKFSNPKKSAHYESNTPMHGSVLAGVPVNVVIDFNFDLAKPSEIKIMKDMKDVGVGETVIDSNKLAMRRYMDDSSPDGLYKVEYKACWPDGSCHDGSFEFAIDRSKASEFSDQTNKKEVIIRMSEIAFKPQNIKVSKATKVIWINDEGVGHYINTDPHPAHSYYPIQNSQLLQKGQNFDLTFNQAGIYPYHCSAHASSMVGAILVE